VLFRALCFPADGVLASKCFNSLNDIIIKRSDAFIEYSMSNSLCFARHAFPITTWIVVFHTGFGIEAGICSSPSNYLISLNLISAFFEVLAVCDANEAIYRTRAVM
jgi:hypothetical protein